MTLPGETIAQGAPPRCDVCQKMPRLAVQHSMAGFYVGTWCDCGPYSRESDYYPTREDAQTALDTGTYGR